MACKFRKTWHHLAFIHEAHWVDTLPEGPFTRQWLAQIFILRLFNALSQETLEVTSVFNHGGNWSKSRFVNGVNPRSNSGCDFCRSRTSGFNLDVSAVGAANNELVEVRTVA